MSGRAAEGGPDATRTARDRLILAVPVVVGLLAAWYVMRHEVLFDPDSGGYVDAARRIARSPAEVLRPRLGGQIVNVGLHPPLYPAALAVFGVVGGEIAGARILNLAVLAATLCLVAGTLRRRTSATTAAVAVWALVVSRGFVVRLHGFVMSDGLYLALALGALVAADLAASDLDDDRRRRRWTAAAGLLAAAAVLTRLVGVALVVALGWSILLGDPDRRRGRRRATAAVTVAALPVVGWLAVQGWTRADTARVGGAPIHLPEALESGREAVRLLLPELIVRTWLGTAAAAVVLVAGAVALFVVPVVVGRWVRPTIDPARRLAGSLLAFGWCHLLVVVTARLAVDRFIWIDLRHLMPTWVAVVVAACLWWGSGRSEVVDRFRTAVVGATVVVLLGASIILFRSVTWPTGPWGNLRSQWGDSPIVAVVAEVPDGVVVHTNRPDITSLLAGRTSVALPLRSSPSTGRPNPAFASQIAEVCRDVRAGRGVVVLVDDGDPDWALPEEVVVRLVGVEPERRVEGGVRFSRAARRCG